MTEVQRKWSVLVAALIVAGGTARLGVWQLDRAAQKIALQQAIETQGRLPPLPADRLAADAAAAAKQFHRRIELEGQWVDGATVFLDNRQMDQRVGFFVLTPLRLSDGSAVVVQRGWVPRDQRDRTALPPVPTAPGTVRVKGLIASPPARLYEFEPSTGGRIRQNLDLPSYALETGLRFRPLSLLQEGDPGDGLLRDWPQAAIDVSRHYGYAFQWFALSALVTGLYVWFQLVRPRRRRSA